MKDTWIPLILISKLHCIWITFIIKLNDKCQRLLSICVIYTSERQFSIGKICLCFVSFKGDNTNPLISSINFNISYSFFYCSVVWISTLVFVKHPWIFKIRQKWHFLDVYGLTLVNISLCELEMFSMFRSSPTQRSFGPSVQWCQNFQVSFWDPLDVYGVSGNCHGDMHNIHHFLGLGHLEVKTTSSIFLFFNPCRFRPRSISHLIKKIITKYLNFSVLKKIWGCFYRVMKKIHLFFVFWVEVVFSSHSSYWWNIINFYKISY